MKTPIRNSEQGRLLFTRENLGFPVPRRLTDLNDDARVTNIDEQNEEGIREEENETEHRDENERIKDGFEWQEDR